MQVIYAAMVTIKGETMTVVSVQSWVMNNSIETSRTISYLANSFKTPIVLMNRNRMTRNVTYFGDPHLTRLLLEVNADLLPFKRYTLS